MTEHNSQSPNRDDLERPTPGLEASQDDESSAADDTSPDANGESIEPSILPRLEPPPAQATDELPGDHSVDLPPHVTRAIEARLPETRFHSRDEYVAYVLERVLVRLGELPTRSQTAESGSDTDETTHTRTNGDGPPSESGEDHEESADVKDRLESLGYL